MERCSGEVCLDCFMNKLVRGNPGGADKETTCLELMLFWGEEGDIFTQNVPSA